MTTPRTRGDFERNLHLLHRNIEAGKFHIPSDSSSDSLARVRNLPNGRLDFLSVDEMARLEANTIANFSETWFQEQLNNHAPLGQTPEPDDNSGI